MTVIHTYKLTQPVKSLLLLFAFLASATLGQTTNQTTELTLNQPLEVTLSGNSPQAYQVKLAANEFAQVHVRQKGIDVMVSVYAPNGDRLTTMDSTAANGLEMLSWIAAGAGVYRFVVERADEVDNSESGAFAIELVARNNATESNRARLKAEALFIGMDRPRIISVLMVPDLLKQRRAVLAAWEDLHDEYMTELLKLMISSLEAMQKRSEQMQADTNARNAIEDEIDARKSARLVVQTGHTASVNSVTLSPDGRLLVSTGSYGQSVILWDAENGQQLKSMSGPLRFVNSVAFSRDGAKLALGMGDGTIQLINTRNGERLKTMPEPGNSQISYVAFLEDSKTVASADWDDHVRLRDVDSGKVVKSWQLVNLFPRGFSDDGEILATLTNNFSLVLLETRTGKEVKRLSGLDDDVLTVVFSADRKRVAASGPEGKVSIWNVETGQRVQIPTGLSNAVRDLVFSLDGMAVVGATYDRTVRWWDVQTGNLIKRLDCSSDVESITLSRDGRTLVCGTFQAIELWNLETGKQIRTLGDQARWISSVVFSPDGKTIASGSTDRTIKLWNLAGSEPPRSLGDQTVPAELTLFSPNGKLLASSVGLSAKPGPSTINLWDLTTGRQVKLFQGHDRNTSSAALSPDGKKLLSGGLDNKVKLWSIDTGQLIRSLDIEAYSGNWVAFSPDGKTFATGGSKDLSIRLWDTETGEPIRSFSGQASYVEALTFSPDGQVLASGDDDGTIQLWNAKTGEHLHELPGHSNSVHSIAFSPDSKTLVSGSSDYTVRLWSMPAGQLIKSLLGHSSDVTSVAFSTGGNLLASGSEDGTIKLWRPTGELLASLITLNKNDWAVITPNGLFDASAGARKLMHYVVGLEPVKLEQMKDTYFVPGLLEMIVNGEALPSKIELFGADDLFPRVEYEPPAKNQTSFEATLVNRGGGIGKVQLFVNGKECGKDSGVDSRPPGFRSDQSLLRIQIDFGKCGLLIPGAQNKVELVTHNSVGSINSRGATQGAEFISLIEGTAGVEPPNIYAIVGGISRYGNRRLNLRYAARDAEDFARTLEIGAAKLVGPNNVHIRLLTSNGEGSQAKFSVSDARVSMANKDNFRNAFDEFRKATPRDVFIVYLAGHGVSMNLNNISSETAGDLYLYLTQEATTTELSESNLRSGTAISSDELANLMKQNQALKQVLILDTCAAGAAVGSLSRRDLPSDRIKAIDRLQSRIGFFVLMGSAADKAAYETTRYGHGLLTYSLLQAIKGGVKLREDKFVDVGPLFSYVQDAVLELANDVGRAQRPIVISPPPSVAFNENGSFDIGLFTSTEQRLIKLESPRPWVLRPTLVDLNEGYDHLNLTPLLRDALRSANGVAFVDADEMVGAIKPSGLYSVKGHSIVVIVRLIRDGTPVGKSLVVNGTNLAKEQLITELIDVIQTNIPK